MPILLTSTISTTRLTTAPITTATSGVTLSLAARKAAWMTTVGRAVCCVFVICLLGVYMDGWMDEWKKDRCGGGESQLKGEDKIRQKVKEAYRVLDMLTPQDTRQTASSCPYHLKLNHPLPSI